MVKILLINVHSACNAGDAALTQVTLQQLRPQFPGCRIVLAMDDPDEGLHGVRVLGSLFHWIKDTGRNSRADWRIMPLLWLIPACLVPVLTYRLFGRAILGLTPPSQRDLIRAYIESDLVVTKPGGFLYSAGLGLTLAISAFTMGLALLAGKPLYLFPQSIGPLTRRWEQWLTRWVIDHCRVVMVRESVSLHYLQEYGIKNQRCYLLPDPAFAFAGVERKSAEEWLQRHGIVVSRDSPFLGMTVMNWGAQNPAFGLQDRYEQACVDAARFFVNQYHGKVILFSQVWGPSFSQDDRVVARRVVARLSDLSDGVVLADEVMSPELLKSVYGLMDVFIGTRMHSNIFALAEGVPVIPIGYLHKTWGIAQMIGWEDWVVDIREINSQVLIEKLTALWSGRDALRGRLRQTLPALVEQARQAGRLVASDFQSLID